MIPPLFLLEVVDFLFLEVRGLRWGFLFPFHAVGPGIFLQVENELWGHNSSFSLQTNFRRMEAGYRVFCSADN